ncbi:MAG TPA: TIGR00730 family Rossman fold protein [Gemmatimonadaceae bacterium]|jgi:hypothetical protein
MRICVFCGSSMGARPEFAKVARTFGRLIAERQIGLVYGGAHVGLMGTIADAALAAGGVVIGVMPRSMVDREIAHTSLTDLRIVANMHERKATMAELSDAFVALPGGLGTLEELFEVWTWAHLGFHRKAVALLDIGGFYDPLIAFLDHAVDERFINPSNRGILLRETDPAALLDRLATAST